MVTGVTGRSVLPPDQYVASLARKRMAATAFFRDEQGRVLLVNPVYKEPWDLPGGAVEAEESPHAACRREVAEEVLADGELAGVRVRSRGRGGGAGDAAAGATGGVVPGRGGGGRGRDAGERQPSRLTGHPAGLGGYGRCAVHSSHAPCDWYWASACWLATVPFTQVARRRRGSARSAWVSALIQ